MVPASTSATKEGAGQPDTHNVILQGNTANTTVVFVHGFGCNSLEFEEIASSVSSQYQVFNYDRVLFQSDRSDWARPRSAEVLVEELRSLLSSVAGNGDKKHLVLVGHSYGGLIAQMFACLHPDEVHGLVLIDPAHEDQFTEVPSDFAFTFKLVPLVLATYQFWCRFGLIRMLDFFGAANFPPLFLYPRNQRVRAVELYSEPSAWIMAAAELKGCNDSFESMRNQRKTAPDLPIRVIIAANRKFSPTFNPAGVTQAFVRMHEPMLQKNKNNKNHSADMVTMVLAEQSDHWVHLQQPEVVVEAIHHICRMVESQQPR